MRYLMCIMIFLSLFFTACFREPATGEIVLLKESIVVGDTVPIVLLVPKKFDELHKEMWYCEKVTEGENVAKFEYIKEHNVLEDDFTQEEVENYFKESPVNIYREDLSLISLYSPRIMLFIPEESGRYIIYVSGYYHSTSPSGITSLEVVVSEE